MYERTTHGKIIAFGIAFLILFGFGCFLLRDDKKPFQEYTASHEAIVNCGDCLIFAIAEVHHYSEDTSYLKKLTIHGPRIYHFDTEIGKDNSCDIWVDQARPTVIIKGEATEESYALMDVGYPKTNGKYCAKAKNSNTLHYSYCSLVNGIPKSERVYFDSTCEAIMFGKSSDCLTCKSHWYE